MAKRSVSALLPAAKPSQKIRVLSRPVAEAGSDSRTDRMVQLIDQCTAAQAIADDLGETFLSYLLAMAIQDARSALRRTSL